MKTDATEVLLTSKRLPGVRQETRDSLAFDPAERNRS